MSRPQSTLYTKRQLEMILARWECSEPVPKAGMLLYAVVPYQPRSFSPLRTGSIIARRAASGGESRAKNGGSHDCFND